MEEVKDSRFSPANPPECGQAAVTEKMLLSSMGDANQERCALFEILTDIK